MKRGATLAALAAVAAISCAAQTQKFEYKFYGRVRADLFYNSRANNETVDGLFYMYPKDHEYDAAGNDLNATVQGSMYMLYTRLGMDIKGPDLGRAKTTAKIELDFRGNGSTFAVPRMRHAYVKVDYGHSSWLVGQTWHPMVGEVMPSVLNLSSGAPFQPFNRSPQIRYRYQSNGWQLTGSAIWQMQFASAGPEGKSHTYLKNSCVPELYAGVDYASDDWRMGIGAEMLTLKPRLRSTVDDKTYKVNERVTSASIEAHASYSDKKLLLAAKTMLANNMTQASMLGGFGVTSVDERTGERTYTPFRHSATWLNLVYGTKWQPGVFVGYVKNLGIGKAITGEQYGVGLDVDQLLSANWQLSYNLPYWKFGVEFEHSTAWYGTTDLNDGRVRETHAVSNFRLLGVLMFIF